MKNEIKAAVDWWKNSLSTFVIQDNGDGFQTALATWVRERQPKPTPEQIEEFGSALTALLEATLPKYWDASDPDRGSTCEGRCLHVDYGPDRMLAAAAQAANIHHGTTLFPVKTTMWLYPGIVKVKQGYSGPEEVIYDAPNTMPAVKEI